MDNALIVRVFVSSPSDVAIERESLEEVVARINMSFGRTNSVRLETYQWKNNAIPRLGPPPQHVIDEQLPQYDIYLGIMAGRFGTPTDGYDSGTEKELRDALENWKAAGKPWILFYFREPPPPPRSSDEAKQLVKLMEFREELQNAGLIATYEVPRGNRNGFFELVDTHLRGVLEEILKSQRKTRSAPKTRRKASTKAPIPERYRAWLMDECSEVGLLGLQLKHSQNVRLNSVYVPVRTLWTETAQTNSREREKPRLMLDLLDATSLYISGAPGSGKSTFSRWVAWLACCGKMPSKSVQAPVDYTEYIVAALQDRLPLLVRLRDLWPFLPATGGMRQLSGREFEKTISAWVEEYHPPELTWPIINSHLDRGTGLMIFDGVDEVPITRTSGQNILFPRDMIVSGLSSFISSRCRTDNRLLVTSRPYGISAADQRKLKLRHAPILELDATQRELLVTHWFHILEHDALKAERTVREMLDDIFGREEVERLSSNPMVCSPKIGPAEMGVSG
jgi:hypothetical protein